MKIKINARRIKPIIPFIGLILVIAIFSIITKGKLLSIGNIKVIFNQAFFLIIAGIGVTFVISQGSLDFSQGSLLGFSGTMAAIFAAYSHSLSLPAALIAGIIIGLINGILLSIFKIPSFIATICMLFILRGLTVYYNNWGSIPIPFEMYWIDNFKIKLIVLIVVIILSYYVFNYTKIGKYCRAIGSGEIAAKYSGIPIVKMKILAFVIAGFLCGLCGFLNVIRTGASSSSSGLLFEVEVLAALVIGGMPLTGGSSAKIYSPILGGLILAILGNGLIISGVDVSIQQAIKGIIFLAAIYISFERESVVLIK